jgi:hypothetical protein
MGLLLPPVRRRADAARAPSLLLETYATLEPVLDHVLFDVDAQAQDASPPSMRRRTTWPNPQ